MSTNYGQAADADLRPVARLLSLAFGSPIDKAEEWVRAAGLEHVRVLRVVSGPPDACLLRVPMGQFFGGRAVPMLGIAGVAVGPEHRGRGLARELMRRAMLEAAGESVPLAGLYASTQSLYRQVGFEQAGHWCRAVLPAHRIGLNERWGVVRELAEADAPAIEACYRAFAARFNGPLDRGPYVWRRVWRLREQAYQPFGVFDDVGRLEGYLFLGQKRKDSGRQDLELSDLAFLTPRAGRRLLTFLAGFATIADEASFHCGPTHPALALMPLQAYAVQRREYWMLRVLNIQGAIEARGYPPGVTARAAFTIEDDLIAANTGTWTVAVEGGRASVARGSAGYIPLVRCGVRGLAAIYTGFLTPPEAALAGLVEGTDDALAAAAAIFSGGTPWMADMF